MLSTYHRHNHNHNERGNLIQTPSCVSIVNMDYDPPANCVSISSQVGPQWDQDNVSRQHFLALPLLLANSSPFEIPHRSVVQRWICWRIFCSHLRATGGEVGASSALAPKIGPLGLSPKKVGEDIAKATGDWVCNVPWITWRAQSDVIWGLERSSCYSQTHYPKPTSSSICCPIRFVPRHQSPQGTPSRPKEGEEHQAQQVHHTWWGYRDCAHNAIQIALEVVRGRC